MVLPYPRHARDRPQDRADHAGGVPMVSAAFYRFKPEVQRVYLEIADHPEGITSKALAEAVPELDAMQRAVAVRKLRERGYLSRTRTPGGLAVWRPRR